MRAQSPRLPRRSDLSAHRCQPATQDSGEKMKTVVIGLDGATFDIVLPLVSSGSLPVLGNLIREGSSAPLRSTIFPNSFPGWSSCTTGTSEGMHGIFSPFLKNPGDYSVRPISGLDLKTRPFWDLLSAAGGRSIVLNVPTTYPPEPIQGLMVCGMLTPALECDFCHPASLKEELLELFPGYLTEPARHPDKRVRAEEFRFANEMHERAAHFLLDHGEWDLFMMVFSALDRVQHDFWADMDPDHPRHDPKTQFRDQIADTYRGLDQALGRLLERLPGEVRVFVVSDHGFCAELMEVRVNEVLARAGLLSFKSPATRKLRFQFHSLSQRIAHKLGRSMVYGNVLDKKVHYGATYLEEIDWARTRAFFCQDKGVWVNLRGREKHGIVAESQFDSVVEETREAMLDLDDDAGRPVFERVMSRAEAFQGANAGRLPDLVLVTARDEWVYNERPGFGRVVASADSTTGTHARDGIFVAWGKGVKSGVRFAPQPQLRDVGPTVLASLGCPLPEDLDGRLLSELVDDPKPPRQGSAYRQAEGGGRPFDETEERQVRERLRALGYL